VVDMTTIRMLDRQAPPSAKELAFLEPNEIAIFGARVDYVTVARTEAALSMAAHWNSALILLTDRRLLVERQALLGKVRIEYEAAWGGVSTSPGLLPIESSLKHATNSWK
jgi:hypothetical protein